MIRHRAFVLGSFAVGIGITILAACGDHAPRVSMVEDEDSADAPQAPSPPVTSDADVKEADTAPSKPHHDASDEPVVCASTPCVKQLAAGLDYFCALLDDGTVRCWGADDFGQLGRGEQGSGGLPIGVPPTPVVGVTSATQISAVGYTTCVRNASRRVQCWGANYSGQLGLQVSPAIVDWSEHRAPTDVALAVDVDRVDVGTDTVCAFGTNDEIYCWGYNQYGLLARPNDPDTQGAWAYHGPGPADFGGYEVIRIAAGYEFAFGLTRDLHIIGWGAVTGRESSLLYTKPAPFPTLESAAAVAMGESFTCAIAAGEIYCWGSNVWGQLGTGFPNNERLPTRARIFTDNGAFPQQLALGQATSCARITDGTIQCTGWNQFGMLGRGDAESASLIASGEFKRVSIPGHVVQIVASDKTFCALLQGGSVMCWGRNIYGELGQGTVDRDDHPAPVAVTLN